MEFVGPVFDAWPPKHHTQILFPAEQLEVEQLEGATLTSLRCSGDS